MKPALTLKLGQQLRMTPQLQQAIRLLQLSTFDLRQEIQEALDSNLMLEEVSVDDTDEATSLDSLEDDLQAAADNNQSQDTQMDIGDTASAADTDAPPNPEIDGDIVPDTHDQLSSDNFGEELPVDSVWEDVWDETPVSSSYSGPDENDENYLDTRNSVDATLQSYLLEQINLLHISEIDEIIAMSIIDGLSADGVLTVSLEDILAGLPQEFEVEMDEVEAVLHLIQHLDPVGVAARDLRECLSIQLKHLSDDVPWRDQALNIVEEHISALANRDYTQLMRKTRLKENELQQVIALIQTLNPRPGAEIAPDKTEYIEPDVIVSKKNGRWVVELSAAAAPHIRVNREYASMVKRSDNSADNTCLKNHLQEARWFIKSLQQRNETLLRVASKIVEYQRGFLEYGEQAMKPLVLHDIAEALDLHESTISRVTTNKYMHTPAGVFELKYFFSSHVSNNEGGEVSSTAIRALIKKLVSDENPRKPLSDSKIATLLASLNVKVARRTVAKYRESMLIPPSNERKQLI
ncbi:MAG: RNA polymerase factor sigma-54 [Pseudomonadales bacterium]